MLITDKTLDQGVNNSRRVFSDRHATIQAPNLAKASVRTNISYNGRNLWVRLRLK